MTTIPEPESAPSSEKSHHGQREGEEVRTGSTCVRKLCEETGVSLLTLAERSGIGVIRLQSIYLGRWTPTPQERDAIAKALDTPTSQIAWEHNTPVEHFYGPG